MKQSLVVISLLMAACGGQPGDLAAETPGSTTIQDTETEPSTSSTVDLEDLTIEPMPEPDYQAIVEAAKADLAKRLGANPGEVAVESAQMGVWSDGSIGCPEPGSLYSQAVVIGSRIVLSHDSETYEYHQAGSDPAFLCEAPVESSFKGDDGDILIPPPGYNE